MNTVVIRLAFTDKFKQDLEDTCEVQLAAGFELKSTFIAPSGICDELVMIFQRISARNPTP